MANPVSTPFTITVPAFQPPRDGLPLPTSPVHAGRQRKLRAICKLDRFFGILHHFERGRDRTKRLILKKLHRAVHAGHDGWLEEIRPQVGTLLPATNDKSAVLYRVGQKIAHPLHVLRTN